MMITKAEAGESVVMARPWDGKKEAVTIEPACADKSNGHWVCVTHPKTILQHNWDRDSHIATGKHRLAWWCNVHGLEQP